MTIDERSAVYEIFAFFLRFVSRHGSPAEQAEILELWQEFSAAFVSSQARQ